MSLSLGNRAEMPFLNVNIQDVHSRLFGALFYIYQKTCENNVHVTGRCLSLLSATTLTSIYFIGSLATCWWLTVWDTFSQSLQKYWSFDKCSWWHKALWYKHLPSAWQQRVQNRAEITKTSQPVNWTLNLLNLHIKLINIVYLMDEYDDTMLS